MSSMRSLLNRHYQFFPETILVPQVEGFDFGRKPLNRDNFIAGVVIIL